MYALLWMIRLSRRPPKAQLPRLLPRRIGRLRLPSAHRKLRLVREYWMRCIWRIWTQVIFFFSSCCSFSFGKKRMRSC